MRLQWKEDGYIAKAGEIKLNEQQTQALAFIEGARTLLTSQQVDTLLMAVGLSAIITNPFRAEDISYQIGSWSSSFYDLVRTNEPIDPVDLRTYRKGELAVNVGTTLSGIGQILGGSLIAGSGGALEIGSWGTAILVAAPAVIGGSALAGSGVATTHKGITGFQETFNKMQGEQGGGSSNDIAKSLKNPESLKGSSIEKVESSIPKEWVKKPMKTGNGNVYEIPGTKGTDMIQVSRGNPKSPDPLHQGPYMKISIKGKTTRISLDGNPLLK